MKANPCLAAVLIFSSSFAADAEVTRRDHRVPSEPGVQLFVREVSASSSRTPILLIHGARVPGIGSFDLLVAGGSLASLAERGFRVYVMDVRGYGRSTRPREMSQPPDANPPLVRSTVAIRDVGAVVGWIRKQTGRKPALLGWATGGNWAGYYASLHSDDIAALVMLNSLYGGSDKHESLGRGTPMEDSQHPGHFNARENGAYRLSTSASLLTAWDRSIPLEDKSKWRDPEVARAYQEAALASDPRSRKHQPPAFRAPSGALEDSFYQAIGQRLWHASFIRVPTLVIRSERDFWSRAEDADALHAELTHAPRKKLLILPGATHHVHLDRAERGRALLLREVVEFLSMR
ncbi:MAG: alpha/beta hydrolase [Acidobacteriales bacterium]|nr:alpha/beta hydrolase [Terriglobales bacterium]